MAYESWQLIRVLFFIFCYYQSKKWNKKKCKDRHQGNWSGCCCFSRVFEKKATNCSKLCKFFLLLWCLPHGVSAFSLANQSRKRQRKPTAARTTPAMSCCVREKENVRQHLARSDFSPFSRLCRSPFAVILSHFSGFP